MKIKLVAAAAALAAVAGSLVATPAAAQFAKAEDAVKYRQSSFTIMANQTGRLRALARGEVPFDAAAAQSSAQVLATVARLPWDAFPAGSDGGAAKVKGDPWKNADDFKALQNRLMAETDKLAAASTSAGDLGKQLGAVGAACKACHDKYRVVQ